MFEMKSMLKQGLKSMKESKLTDEALLPSDSDDQYPYGLRLDLDEKSMSTLGLDATKFNVGDELKIECKVEVISIRANKDGYGSSQNLELQVTHIALDED